MMEFIYEKHPEVDKMFDFVRSEIGEHGRHEEAYSLLYQQLDQLLLMKRTVMLSQPVKVLLTPDESKEFNRMVEDCR